MRKISVWLSACLIFTLCASIAAADSLLEEIRAYVNKEISFTVDGAPWQAKSGDNIVYPITYNGSTYLPVRAVADALDVPIQWDGDTKTVHIGGTSEHVPVLSESHGLFSATITEDEQDRKLQGVDYGKVIWFETILHSTSRFQLEPAGQYSKLVLKVGIEGDDTQIKLVNTSLSTEIRSVLVSEADGVVEIEAPITGVDKVMVEVMAAEPNTKSTVKILAEESYYTTED